ncbi:MAG: hypothetical protein SOY50_05365, partial [Ruminococcus callidus]|nr:hypothetical protein [Ruminococcus callidus]
YYTRICRKKQGITRLFAVLPWNYGLPLCNMTKKSGKFFRIPQKKGHKVPFSAGAAGAGA